MKLKQSLTSYTKVHLKWIKVLYEGLDIMQLFKENIGRTLSDINHSNIFLNSPPRVMKINTKINKWDLVKLKSFCTANYKQNIKTTYRMRENRD